MILKYQKEGQLKEYIKECSDRAESPYRFLLSFFYLAEYFIHLSGNQNL